MAQIYSFFDQLPDDLREYNAEDYARYWRSFLSTGIYNAGTNLEVYCNGLDRIVKIKIGKAFIEGYYYENTTEYELTLDAADGTLDRIDRIILRLDRNPENRYIKAFVLKGNPGSIPVAPTLTQDDTIFEIALAQVMSIHNTSIIEPSNITDERLDNSVCGIVTSLIEVDTASMQVQFDAFMSTLDASIFATQTDVGHNVNLQTTQKDNLVNAINEVKTKADEAFQTGVDRKTEVVGALNSKITITASTIADLWSTLIQKIRDIQEGSGNASKADVLSGKTFTNNDGTEYTGTMPDYSDAILSTQNGGTIIETIDDPKYPGVHGLIKAPLVTSGYMNTNTEIVQRLLNLAAHNIKAGVTIGGADTAGMTGTFTADADAAASHILSGKKAYVDGALVTGTMANKTGGYTTDFLAKSGNELRMSIDSAGYFSDGAYLKYVDNDWIEDNIRGGVNIFGKVGTLNEGLKIAQGTTTTPHPDDPYEKKFTLRGLSFRPKYVFLSVNTGSPIFFWDIVSDVFHTGTFSTPKTKIVYDDGFYLEFSNDRYLETPVSWIVFGD